ncbi:MAG: ATP-binding cassette domain-containing protein [Desulfobacteraceae bacterium]|jgi:phospholipid/cholesterol/gamma-HCH transport system ATP-binding protein|nr:ATP-binding cassette domain-containing protein [Desulfobacteraceae bacterium]
MDEQRQPLIEFKGVSKTFGTRNILNKIDFSIYEGEVTTLIGLSGTGKSVTLKHIIGMLQPDEGEILFRGKAIHKMSKAEWNDYIGQIAYMFQNNALFDSLTVFENVAMPLKYASKLKKKEIEAKAMARIEQTELTEVFDKYPSEISGGMQKRAALARALVTDPNIVLFDEPTTGQDPIRKNAILGMVAEYQKRFGFTALMISHEIPDVYFISNRILALYDRKIVFQGDPEEFESLDHPFRQELISSLESLGEELTGLYSKRHFKVRYQTDLSSRRPDATYAAAVFTIDDIDAISANLGHDITQQIIRSLGSYINKHFGAVGGFSSRQTINEYATVLPYSDIEEAERIMKDFTKDFQEHGMGGIEAAMAAEEKSDDCVEFSVLAGLAQGKPQIEIESVMEFARFNQNKIAQFSCARGGKA